MSILSLENITRSYRAEPVLDGVTFGLEAGEKIGVIGANGSGKTTLLRIMAGVETPEAGRVVVASGTVVGYLPQNPVFDPQQSVLDALFAASTEAMRLMRAYEQACHDMAAGDAAAGKTVDELAGSLEAIGAWDLETSARTILTMLGVTDTDALMGTLSGGMRKRVALAHALIERPDLLILDEPTNHLDTDAIDWLENWLAHYGGALVLVTHDRYFLDRVTKRTLEVERAGVQSFSGNYATYLEKKAEQEMLRTAEGEKRANLLKRELAWLRRGARARATKQKAHVERAEALVNAPREARKTDLDIATAGRRLGGKSVEMEKVTKAYGERVILKDFSYNLKRGERIGIIGPNGSGKTTMLELMASRLAPEGGRVETGSTVKIGYYDQESGGLQDDMRVIDYVRDEAEAIETADGSRISAAQMLERFLFPGALQHSFIGKLSGGERRRLYLLRILMGAPNVLLLDEPTNDLDIPTLVRLEAWLDDFAGCVVVASHDRYFLDRTVDSIFRLEGQGRVRQYAGNYSAFKEVADREAAAAEPVKARKAAAPVAAAAVAVSSKVRKLSYKERDELKALETSIPRSEARLKEIQALLAGDTSNYAATEKLFKEQQTLEKQLDRDMERWTTLAELA